MIFKNQTYKYIRSWNIGHYQIMINISPSNRRQYQMWFNTHHNYHKHHYKNFQRTDKYIWGNDQ
jgi:hypothetical protein